MLFNTRSFTQSGVETLATYGAIRCLTMATPQTAALSAAATTLGHLALSTIGKYVTPRHKESWSEMIGRWALKVPQVHRECEKEVRKEYYAFKEKALKSWEKFGKPVTEVPEKGFTFAALRKLMHKYAQLTNDPLCERQLSGTIYSSSLQKTTPKYKAKKAPTVPKKATPLEKSMKYLNAVLPEVVSTAGLWNPLHIGDFPIGNFIEYQVVRMVGKMFGAEPEEINGFVTSGGTESLIQAVYGYRQWGREKKGHGPTESVVIVPDTIHASLDKAETMFDVKLVKIPTDKNGNVSIQDVSAAIKKYGSQVVALFGSAPSYPTGQVDQIAEMAQMAKDAKIGFHVDCCLGGFVINELQEANFLKLDGVTSLSCDTHKNGLAPKGSSVLVTKADVEQDVTYYSTFSIPGWKGGIYGTPRFPGSQSCVNAYQTLLTLLAVGKQGYRENGKLIQSSTAKLKEMFEKEFKGIFKVLGDTKVNVFAFEIDADLKFEQGAIYALVHELEKLGITLNALKGEAVHLCVTNRFAAGKNSIENFKQALREALAKVQELNEKVQKGDAKFPGDAPLYSTVSQITEPKLGNQSWSKFFENTFVGPHALKAIVRHYFRALQNPYREGDKIK